MDTTTRITAAALLIGFAAWAATVIKTVRDYTTM